MEDDLYPILLYVYDETGHYGEPIEIVSKAQLNSEGIKLVVRIAMDLHREIRMTDPMDRLVFHAAGGAIVFPTEEDRRGVRHP